MYTALDRTGVINKDKLKKEFPSESENDRYLIANRFFSNQKHARILGYPCIFGFVSNAFIIGFFMKRKEKKNNSVETTS